ncbi:TPA: hypothetical protein R1721_001612, partial [Campylobacter lari]|nr:hypothetical protein [Campylobacter lari]
MGLLEKNINKEETRENQENQENQESQESQESQELTHSLYYAIYELRNKQKLIEERIEDQGNKFEERIKDEGNKFEERIKDEGNKFEERIKEIQKQYITILGIFASIVLTFVSSFAFSSSILSHMHQVSIYRLIFVILCIGLFVANILYGLYSFLIKIHNGNIEYNKVITKF